MDGLLLRLQNDQRGKAGNWFWPCFEPLRAEIDRRWWIVGNQPWRAAPKEFTQHEEKYLADFDGLVHTSVQLWRPGAVSRWAQYFCEEFISLLAIRDGGDPAKVASKYSRVAPANEAAFIISYAEIWLAYCDSTCWEIYCREPARLVAVRTRISDDGPIQAFEISIHRRAHAFARAGLAEVWRAIHGLGS